MKENNVSVQQIKKNLIISIAFAAVSAASLLFIPLTNINGKGMEKYSVLLIGILFWISFILSQIFSIKANIERKKTNGEHTKRIGMFSFFKSKAGIAADVFLIISAIGEIILLIVKYPNEWVASAFTAILFMSLYLHCIFNGINYLYINKKCFVNKEDDKNEL